MFFNTQKQTQRDKMRRHRDIPKERGKTIARELNETESSTRPDKKFRSNDHKDTHWTWKKVNFSKTLNKETENIKNQSEMKNTINEIKNTLDGARFGSTHTKNTLDGIGWKKQRNKSMNKKTRVMQSNQGEQMSEKNIMQNEERLRELSDFIKQK